MNSEIADILKRGANDAWSLGLSNAQIALFCRYAEILLEWNSTRMNLTRIVEPADIAVKHFLDSLLLLTAVKVPNGARVIDVGTGAGLPGIALKIARPDLRMTLLDSTAKKLQFCRAVVDDLGLATVDIIHGRAEEVGLAAGHAGSYDIVASRAVAPLEKLLPWCAPFVRQTGRVVAMKGSGVEEELPAGRSVAPRLGLRLLPPLSVELPESAEGIVRQVIVAVRSVHPPSRRPRRTL